MCHENAVRDAAISLAENPSTSSRGEALASIAGSHKLFCVRPMPGEGGYIAPRSTVISPHVQLIIQAAVSREHDEMRKRFYKMLSHHPHCRSVIGRLLEQQFHKWVGLDADAHAPGAKEILTCVSPSLPALHLTPTREVPLDTIEDLAATKDSDLPVYYRPTSERSLGVDGFILTADAVVLIQVTVSPAHALKREHLVLLYDNLPTSIRDKPWKFVWVVPERDVGEALRKRKFNVDGNWSKIGFYWCLFRFDTEVSFGSNSQMWALMSVPQEGASKDLRLDIAETGVEEDEHHIEMWEADEENLDEGEYENEGPSTSTAPAPRRTQNKSKQPAKKARTTPQISPWKGRTRRG